MEQIETLFKKRGFRMAENNRKQAYIPEGLFPLKTPREQPWVYCEYSNGSIISIPGVPPEMEYLMEANVIPYIRKRFELKQQVIQYRFCVPVAWRECDWPSNQRSDEGKSKPSVGTLASIGDIRIRITANAEIQKRHQT